MAVSRPEIQVDKVGRTPFSRYYVFTLNNYSDDEKRQIKSAVENKTCIGKSKHVISYCCYGEEVAESGTKHLQGYLELSDRGKYGFDIPKFHNFARAGTEDWDLYYPRPRCPCPDFQNFSKSTVRYASIHSVPGFKRCSFKVRHGTQEEARKYCMKGEQPHQEWEKEQWRGPRWGLAARFVEYGELAAQPQPGKRNDLHALYQLAKDGASVNELMDADFEAYNKCYKVLERVVLSHAPVRTTPRKVILFYGRPGIGKTRWVFKNFAQKDIWEQPVLNTESWMDGYDGQKVALFDEFEGSVTLNVALKLFDPWYCRKVPVKGGFVWFNPDIIVITTNTHPSKWYDYTSNRKEKANKEQALRDRFIRSEGAIYAECKDGGLQQVNIKQFWMVHSCDSTPDQGIVYYDDLKNKEQIEFKLAGDEELQLTDEQLSTNEIAIGSQIYEFVDEEDHSEDLLDL